MKAATAVGVSEKNENTLFSSNQRSILSLNSVISVIKGIINGLWLNIQAKATSIYSALACSTQLS